MHNCTLCGIAFPNSENNASGLCPGCDLAVSIDIQEKLRVMRRCEHAIHTSSGHQTRLYNCLLLMQKAKWLRKYEKMGIPTVTPLPSEWIDRYSEKYDDIVFERIFKEVNDTFAEAEKAVSSHALDSRLNFALQKITEGKNLFLNKEKYKSLNVRVMSYLYSNMLTLTV